MMNEGKQVFLLADSLDSKLVSLEDVINTLKAYEELVQDFSSVSPDILNSEYGRKRFESIQSVFRIALEMLESILAEMKIDVEEGFKTSQKLKKE